MLFKKLKRLTIVAKSTVIVYLSNFALNEWNYVGDWERREDIHLTYWQIKGYKNMVLFVVEPCFTTVFGHIGRWVHITVQESFCIMINIDG